MKLAGMLANKFNSMDSDAIEQEWKLIEEGGENATTEKVESVLKRTPGFTAIDMIHFGEYCKKGFTDYEWDGLSPEEHFTNWLGKIK